MTLRISELKLPPDHTERELQQEIRRILRLSRETFEYEIIRRSIDARKKPNLSYVYTIDVTTEHPGLVLKRIHNKKVQPVEKKEYRFPFQKIAGQVVPAGAEPVVVGSGPAGLFCALMLARAGLRPVVLERGEPVEKRVETVRSFWEGGRLNPESNVQFGEGGAGTFSDGKLNTLIKDPDGKIRFVLKEFVRAGAPEEILYHHKPHIGTDVLTGIVRVIREEIRSLGGEFFYDSCLTGLSRNTSHDLFSGRDVGHGDALQADGPSDRHGVLKTDTGMLSSGAQHSWRLEINRGERIITTEHLVLAIGHSARDTLSMLYGFGLPMQAKAFAVGLRVEHGQKMINDAMYGPDCPYELGAAPYKLTHKCADGRGVYSFCMCPGGYVVNASSEPGRTAVNGMSYSSRDSENANSAIVVTVTPEDYGAEHPLSGIAFQRKLEEAAYACGAGRIPVQRFGDFCEDVPTKEFGAVRPRCRGAYAPANLRGILPEQLNECIIEGIHGFGRRIPGFDSPDALLSGVESRTSSPVRILRDDTCQSTFPGIYPCGEGAGYAGGITSAAVDGIRVAEHVCESIFGIRV